MKLKLRKHQHAYIFSPRKFPLLDGGMGNGKSTAGILKLGIHCQNNPGTKAGFFRQDYTDIRRGSLEDWNEIWGDFGEYNEKSHFFTFYDSGSKVLFHQLSDTGKLKNHNLSAALIEQAEETDQEAFSYLVPRLRRQDTDNSNITFEDPRTKRTWSGSMPDRWLGCLTNPEGHDWVWDIWHNKDLSDLAIGQGAFDLPDEMQITQDDFHLIWADTFANIKNLPKDYLAGLQAMPDHLWNRYVEGSRDSFEGQIFKMLDRDIHLIEPFEIPKQYNKYLLFDHGINNPSAFLWIALDPDDNAIVYREHYKKAGDEGKNWVVSDHVDEVLYHIDNENDPVCPYQETINGMWADPQIFNRTREKDGEHYTIAEEYVDHSDGRLMFQPWKKASGPKEKQAQINRTAEYFKVNPARNHIVTGESPAPQMYFFSTCDNAWEEHIQYQWKDQAKRIIGAAKNNPEKPRDYKDHTPDCTGGFVAMKRTGPSIKTDPPPGSWEDIHQEMKKRRGRSSGSSRQVNIR